MGQRIRDNMTRIVQTVRSAAAVSKAARIMADYQTGFVPVVDSDRVVGVLTDRDIVVRVVVPGASPYAVLVKQIMTTTLVFAHPDWELTRAARVMAEERIRRLLVVEDDVLVGVLSLADLALGLEEDEVLAETIRQITRRGLPIRHPQTDD